MPGDQFVRGPVLFLDFDGVLNHSAAFERHRSGLIIARCTEVLDSHCVAELDRVVATTGCEVVVSSTWRLGHTLLHLEQLLAGAGYTHALLGATPSTGRHRGADIAAWLARHPGWGPIAIVDDDSDMGKLGHRLVQTRFDGGGLTAERADRLIELLGEARNAS